MNKIKKLYYMAYFLSVLTAFPMWAHAEHKTTVMQSGNNDIPPKERTHTPTQQVDYTLAGQGIVLLIILVILYWNRKLVRSQQQAKQALPGAGEARYRAILDTTAEGYWRIGPDRRTVEVNRALCEMLGYSEDEMRGRSPLEFADEKNQAIFRDQMAKIEAIAHRSYEITLRRKDGTAVHTIFHATTLRGEAGDVLGGFAFVSDITALKQTQASLQQQQQRLRMLNDFAADSEADTATMLRNAMDRACGMLGMDLAVFARREHGQCQVISHNCPHDSVFEAVPACNIVPRKGNVTAIENAAGLSVCCREMHPAAYLGIPVFVANQFYGELCFSRECSTPPISEDDKEFARLLARWIGAVLEREQATQVLRESEEKLRGLYELSPLGIALTDMQGRFIEFNDAFVRICGGYTVQELKALDYWTLTPREYEAREAMQLESLAQSGRYGPYEKEYRRKDGSRVPLRLNGMLVTGRDGQSYIWSLVEDISAQKCNEAELRRAKEQAEAASHAKSMFLANMSHELRTPLNAILGFSRLMANDPAVGASQQESLHIINRSGEHLLEMINDILDLSKIEAGRMELATEPFELPRLLEDIGAMIRVRAESKDLDFVLQSDPDMARFVRTDAGKLRQILINLLGNAVKFTRQGKVVLRARTNSLPVGKSPPAPLFQREEDFSSPLWKRGDRGDFQPWLELEVEDSGPGIPAERLAGVFKPFVQAGSIGDIHGTGLGLAITRSFVDLMGGGITVESTPGKGTRFSVRLPLMVVPAEKVAASEPPAHQVAGLAEGERAWRVLVVEDNAENRHLLTTLLQQTGFRVYEAENGAVAVEVFRSRQPHFIWMDIRMPVLNGCEATRRIRALPGGEAVKIVALTAHVFKEQHAEILAAGCNEVVHKPFRDFELFDAMQRQLGVRYRYAETAVPADTAVAVSTEAVAALPAELREALREAAESLSNVQFDAALMPVHEHDPTLAAALAALAREFRFDRILTLLDV